MQHKCKITVIRRKGYEGLQAQCLADPKSGPCALFNGGQALVLVRIGEDLRP